MASFYVRSRSTGKKTGFSNQQQLEGYLSKRGHLFEDLDVSLDAGSSWHPAGELYVMNNDSSANKTATDSEWLLNIPLYIIGIWIVLTLANKFYRIEFVNQMNHRIELVYRDVKSRVLEVFDKAEDKAAEIENGDLTN